MSLAEIAQQTHIKNATGRSRVPRALVISVGLVGLLVLAVVAVVAFLDLDAFTPRFEAAASRALGLDVAVGGRLRIRLLPALLVTLNDVHIRRHGEDIAASKQAALGLDALPLLRGEVRVSTIRLTDPRVSIVRSAAGALNYENPRASGATLPTLRRAHVLLSHATFSYADQQAGREFLATDCRLDLHDLNLPGGPRATVMKRLGLTGDIACGEMRTQDFNVSDVRLHLDARDGVFVFDPVAMPLFGATGAGSIRADFSGAAPAYQAKLVVSRFRIEEFFGKLSTAQVAAGAMDFSANVSTRGNTMIEATQSMDGQISLRGENLTLHGEDLDERFAKFESSQNFNLVDVGALFFAGPFGLVVTKGYNFATIAQGSQSGSDIKTLVSDWRVEGGVAHATDVAMATRQNRVALQGRLDFVHRQFDDVTVALIDANGCTMAQQDVHGTFLHPVMEQANILVSLGGSALNLLKEVGHLLPDGDCSVFYAGSVAAPP